MLALTALFFLMLSGCSIFRSSSRFRNEDIKLGVSKAFILEKYGKPFKEELYMEDGDTIEVLCYKEGLYASLNEHMVSTRPNNSSGNSPHCHVIYALTCAANLCPAPSAKP